MHTNQKLPLTFALATLMMCGSASAAITVYTSEASFRSAISAPATDTFNDLTVGTFIPGPASRSAGPYNYTVTTAANALLFVAGSSADPWLSTEDATDSIVFLRFNGGVRAAGAFFFGSNFQGMFTSADVRVTATDAGGTVSRALPGATTRTFLGFISTGALTGLEVDVMQPLDTFVYPTVNDLTLAMAAESVRVVPLPGTLALMAPALLLTGLVARRRRR